MGSQVRLFLLGGGHHTSSTIRHAIVAIRGGTGYMELRASVEEGIILRNVRSTCTRDAKEESCCARERPVEQHLTLA